MDSDERHVELVDEWYVDPPDPRTDSADGRTDRADERTGGGRGRL